MSLEDEISANLSEPRALEKLFRSSDPRAFRAAILKLRSRKQADVVLAIWEERLTGTEEGAPDSAGVPASSICLIVGLSFFCGLYAKLPAFFTFIDANTYYPANAAFFVFSGLIAYFLLAHGMERKRSGNILVGFFACVLFSNILTSVLTVSHGRPPDTLVLSGMHMPFVLWSLLGAAFLGDQLEVRGERIRYLAYTGETLVYSVVILIGGMILTGLTMALFGILGMSAVSEWYVEWIVVLGSVSAPLVATWISTNRFVSSGKISPLMAKIFAPLLLITLVVYLLALPAAGKGPFLDRQNLIVFNGMLISVLALSVFAIVERPVTSAPSALDKINFGLVCVGLLINSVALAAILFRLATYGLTPNRLAVLGSNIVIFIHVVLIWKAYLAFLRGRGAMAAIHGEIARYLPVYAFWVSVVAFGFPLIFWSR